MFFDEYEDKAEKEHVYQTEVSETKYMGEGSPGVKLRKDQTEVSETAYMDEPEKRDLPKHGTEYKRFGRKVGKANMESNETREKFDRLAQEIHERWKKEA